jgi:ABC-type transporter Mla subunit MlaD
LHETARAPRAEQRDDEHLVAVRRDVLNDVEHAVGNLLQRMHHTARAATAVVGPQAERLQSTLDDLERLLELLFDYVSPVEVDLRPTDADRIAESLAAQLRAQGLAEVTLGSPLGVRVLADPRLLSRAFSLLAQACGRECDGGQPVAVEAVHDAAADRVEFRVRPAAEIPAAATAQSSMAEAVAGRLIELQGGELRARPRAGARAVVLPTAG